MIQTFKKVAVDIIGMLCNLLVSDNNAKDIVNDKKSKVAALHNDNRMYHLLESVGTKPNVMYQVKVRNTDEV